MLFHLGEFLEIEARIANDCLLEDSAYCDKVVAAEGSSGRGRGTGGPLLTARGLPA